MGLNLYICLMFEAIPLNLPAYPLRISTDGKRHFVYDELRRKDLIWTPEEWVRQHWVHHLIQSKNYPKNLIKIEGGLQFNGMQRRSDLVIYNNLGEAIVLAEFKRPSVRITEEVLAQIARYNFVYKIPLLLVSNGIQHYFWEFDKMSERFVPLDDLPPYCHAE